MPKRSNKSRTNKEEGEDDAPKKPDNDVDPAHPDGDHHGGDGGGKNSDIWDSNLRLKFQTIS